MNRAAAVFALLAAAATAGAGLEVKVYTAAPTLLSGAEIIRAGGGAVTVVSLADLVRLEERLTRHAGSGAGEGRVRQAIDRLDTASLPGLMKAAAAREEAVAAGVDLSNLPAALFKDGARSRIFYGADLRRFYLEWRKSKWQ